MTTDLKKCPQTNVISFCYSGLSTQNYNKSDPIKLLNKLLAQTQTLVEIHQRVVSQYSLHQYTHK